MASKAAALFALMIVLLAAAAPGEARSLLTGEDEGPATCTDTPGTIWSAKAMDCVPTPTTPTTVSKINACNNRGQYAFLSRTSQVACTANGGTNTGGKIVSVSAANGNALFGSPTNNGNAGGNSAGASGADGGAVAVGSGPSSCGQGQMWNTASNSCAPAPTTPTAVSRIKACNNKGQYAVLSSASQVACQANGGTNTGGTIVAVSAANGNALMGSPSGNGDAGYNDASASGANGGTVTIG